MSVSRHNFCLTPLTLLKFTDLVTVLECMALAQWHCEPDTVRPFQVHGDGAGACRRHPSAADTPQPQAPDSA